MTVRELIFNQLSTGTTGTSNIFFHRFPDSFDNSNESGLVFDVESEVSSSFDAKQFLIEYELNLVSRSQSLSVAESILAEAKDAIYRLEQTPYIAHVEQQGDDLPLWNNDLKTWDCFSSFVIYN